MLVQKLSYRLQFVAIPIELLPSLPNLFQVCPRAPSLVPYCSCCLLMAFSFALSSSTNLTGYADDVTYTKLCCVTKT